MIRAMRFWGPGACAVMAAASIAAGSSNLVVNGSFDDPKDPLYGWKYKFDLPGESWYFQNHEHVKVVPSEGNRNNVLALWGNHDILNGTGQGTKVDSSPIPVKPNAKFRLTVSAHSKGPDARILIEGYRWRPGIKPHADAQLWELRKCTKSPLLFFGGKEGGEMSNILASKGWETASMTFSTADGSKEKRQAWEQVEFLVVHIIAISGEAGTLYVDDVELVRLNN